ncbi:uncharacterized protein N7469_000384 [Penicillium citrinum]|uniref:Uncharacterized protein n=1 Tax=Penicillium citrinum TaxID=5077 RepID=A0A9W9PCL6_PENCI|nr:uncharacterized protein N7469_000384 [Penicillium citrinum]KAJ5242057.1 hypothetical protein N7469_000384 [Penicillium citrinum]
MYYSDAQHELTYLLAIPGSSGPMVGNPTANATGNGTSKPPCQNQQLLFVPGQDPTDHQMGFTQNATSNQIITKFIWYGHFSLVESDSGKYKSLFYAKKTEHDDVLSLQWNITDEDDEGDFISISMPGLPPSNA